MDLLPLGSSGGKLRLPPLEDEELVEGPERLTTGGFVVCSSVVDDSTRLPSVNVDEENGNAPAAVLDEDDEDDAVGATVVPWLIPGNEALKAI